MVGSEDRPTSTHMYSLAFKENGDMVVLFKRDYDDAYRKPDEYEILPSEFDKYVVDGVPLRKLVVEKLKSVFAKPNKDTTQPA
jgi:hypothetical protein